MADAWNTFWDNWRRGVDVINDNIKKSIDAGGNRYAEARDHFQNKDFAYGVWAGIQATFAEFDNIIKKGHALPEAKLKEEPDTSMKPGQGKEAKPPLSDEKFNENIDKIIEFTEKSRNHGYGGFNSDYEAARYLIEDMAERAGRDDVKPTEVIDAIKGLTNSGGIESQKQYLRDHLGSQAEKAENKEATVEDSEPQSSDNGTDNPALNAFAESARRMGDAVNGIANPKRDDSALRDAFGDDVVDHKDETPELDDSDGINF